MCDTCDTARKQTKPEALKTIAQRMQRKNPPACLDELIGELVGEPTPKVDYAAEGAFESRRRARRE